jgi:hypothetical protein
MAFEARRTIKNWRWWVVLPIAVLFLAVAFIPKIIISALEILIALVEVVNFGDKSSPRTKQLVDWVNRG